MSRVEADIRAVFFYAANLIVLLCYHNVRRPHGAGNDAYCGARACIMCMHLLQPLCAVRHDAFVDGFPRGCNVERESVSATASQEDVEGV